MITLTTFILLVAMGVTVGAFGTLVGAGGGFILTPVLLLLYPDAEPQTITAISMCVIFFNAASGSVAYARQRRIDYRAGLAFALATLPGSVVGVVVVAHVPRKPFTAIMAALLIALGIVLVRGLRDPHPLTVRGATPRGLVDRNGVTYRYAVPMRRGVILSTGVGFASSFLGIGGGVIHVPLLVQFLGFPTHIATATSHFVLAGMAGVATFTHVFSGHFAHGYGLRRALALSIGVIPGAQLGARLSTRLQGQAIQRLLAGALLVLAARLILQLV